MREIKEELDSDIEVLHYFSQSLHPYDQRVIKLMVYWAVWRNGQLNLREHESIEWVEFGKLDQYNFLPADYPIVNSVLMLSQVFN
ncbi:NUDIX domain-containing protein [Paenibacillus peoriae]|uniref:NUDIX domain-containing protein n=1 Tax=Paenibacillus peoriae TaxID=59893 RepID=UPI003D27653B